MSVGENAHAQRIGEVILAVEGVSLAFGGVQALKDVSFDVREHEVRAMPWLAASCGCIAACVLPR